MKTVNLPLYHHVYSSIGGYKTLYASREISAEFRETLEEFATQIYTSITRHPLYLSFRHMGFLWLMKVFFHGSDHVGRPRKCVHTVLLAEGLVGDLPFFSSLDFPREDIFLSTNIPLDSIYGHLHPSYPFELYTPEERFQRLQEMGWSHEDFSIIYNLLLAQSHSAVLITDSPQLEQGLRWLVGLLPWALRYNLPWCSGALLNRAPVPLRVFVISEDSFRRTNDSVEHLVAVDLENRSLSQNYPNPNKLGEFLTSRLEENPQEAFKLLHFMESYPLDRPMTHDMFASLVSAFAIPRRAFPAAGRITVENSPRVWIENMVKFSQAGYDNVALEIALQCVRLLRDKHAFHSVGELEKRLEYLVENYREYLEKKESVMEAVTRLLKEFFAKVTPAS